MANLFSIEILGDVHVVHGDSGDVTGEHAHRHDGDDVPDHRREEERVDETGRKRHSIVPSPYLYPRKFSYMGSISPTFYEQLLRQ